MKKLISIIYCFVSLLFYSSIFSQNSVINSNSETDLNFKKINIEIEGEKVFDVDVITQDHQGYMWIATNLGLIRYNGYEGKKFEYKRKGSTSISNDYIRSLFVDHKGDLWIGARSGLSKYNPDCDCLHQYPTNIDNIDLTNIWSIKSDKNNNIWIGTRGGNLFQYDHETESLTSMIHEVSYSQTLVHSGIWHLAVDEKNNVWMGTDAGLLKYNITTGIVKQFVNDPSNSNSLLDNRISALYKDQQGQILIGTYKSGFHIYNPDNEILKRITFDTNNPSQLHAPYSEESVFGNDPRVNLIHQDQNENYWIGTTGKGLNYFNTRTKTFKNYHFNLVNPQILWSIYEDRQGNLWTGGSMGSGLFRANLFARQYQLNKNVTNLEGVYESPLNPGILWIKSHEIGLSRIDFKTDEVINYQHDENNIKSIGHNWVRSIYQENNRTIWIGLGNGGAYGNHDGKGGVDRMDIETGVFTHFKLTRDDDGRNDFSYTVYTICEDHEGYLWLGAGPGGIFRSDKAKKEFKHFRIFNNDSVSDEVFLNITRIDSNGDIWASDFAGEGTLYLFDRQEKKFNPYLTGFKMYNLLVDDNGWLLIGTWEKGLVHLNPVDRTYIQYTKEDGLASNDGIDIAKGENGLVWVNTRLGPSKFDTKSGQFTFVGLPKQRYNTGIFKASNDKIYMGSPEGLISFHPRQVVSNPFPPEVILENMYISGKPFNLQNISTNKSEIFLAHNQNDLTFEYTGLHFSDPTKNKYRYILEPYDSSWINAGTQRTVRYTNLDPGEYSFQVTASNIDGIWNEKGTVFNIVISKPWWQTYLAYLVYLLLGFSLLYFLRRYELSRQKLKYNLKLGNLEKEKLKEIDQVKSRFFANISHEFRTPLTLIFGPTKDISENAKDVNIKKSAGIIQKHASKLYDLVNQLLDLSKLEAGKMKLETKQQNIIPLLKGLVLSFTSLAERKKITLSFETVDENLNVYIDNDKVEKIINNILSNAFKFTPEGGKIECKVLKLDSKIEVSIKDSGIGIPKERIDRIFDRFYQVDGSSTREGEGTGIGLALTKELVELHKGQISVESEAGKGTIFKLRIPLGKAHLKSEEIVAKEQPEETTTTIPKPELISEIDLPKERSAANKLLDTNFSGEKEGKPLLLIVEDNFDVRNYIISHLEEDYIIYEAIDGDDGFAKSIEQFPDLIISDVMMPKMDGFQLCEKLKTDERTSHIPIILLTAKATSENKIEGFETGADDYIMKPFDAKELQARIKNLINQRKKLQKHFQKEGLFNLENKKIISVDKKFLEKAIKIINEHISDTSFGVELFASELAISRAALHKKLVSLIGEPPSELIKRIRLSKAGILVKNNTGNISEIALEVGFNNPAYFAECFKKQFNETPSQYQRKFTQN